MTYKTKKPKKKENNNSRSFELKKKGNDIDVDWYLQEELSVRDLDSEELFSEDEQQKLMEREEKLDDFKEELAERISQREDIPFGTAKKIVSDYQREVRKKLEKIEENGNL